MQALHGNVKTLQSDLDTLNLNLQNKEDKLSQIESSFEDSQRALHSKDIRIKELIKLGTTEKEMLQKQFKMQEYSQKKTLQMIMDQKKRVEVQLGKSISAYQNLCRDAITAEERNRREFESALNELIFENANLDKSNIALKNELTVKEMETESSITKLRQALKINQYDTFKIKKENHLLQSEIKLVGEASERSRNAYVEAQRIIEQLTNGNKNWKERFENSEMKIGDITLHSDVHSSHL